MVGRVAGAGAEVELLRDGRFAVFGRLGTGAQGETLSAVDRREGRPVAIKRFRIRGASSWKDVELAEREARVLARLSHPALPRYVDHFEEGGCLYLVMDLVEGESLASLRARGHAFDEATVVRFLRDASAVLDYLHGQTPPVIHRDLKPGNVVLRRDGSFAFVDFGAVRDTLRPEGGSTVVGTFGYMAPEQFQGRAIPASDVYSIGATALALLTGRGPEELPHRGLALDVRAALGPRANPRLVAALERMLLPDPEQRASALAPLLGSLAPGPASPGHSRAADAAGFAAAPAGAGTRAGADDDPFLHEAGARRRHRRRHRGRHRDEEIPRALALVAIGILRWVLALLFSRAVPKILARSGVLATPEAARTQAAMAALERSLTEKLAGLEARVTAGDPGATPSAVPFEAPAGRRYRAPEAEATRRRGEAIDVEGEDVTEAPPEATSGRARR